MKLETYKEVYRQPISHIKVPKELQNQPFEVLFVPITISDETKANVNIIKNKPNPLLKGLATIYDDISPLDNDWELD